MSPSAYGRLSVDEDLADSYAYTLLGKLDGSPERRDWMLRELSEARARCRGGRGMKRND